MFSRAFNILRPLGVRYLFLVGLTIIVIVVGQILIQYDLELQKDDARLINISGRQRMLSQRIGRQIFHIQNILSEEGLNQSSFDSLESLLSQFENGHKVLMYGNKELGVSGSRSEPTKALLRENLSHLTAVVNAGRRAIEKKTIPSFEEAGKVYLLHEPIFLPTMEKTVATFEMEARAKLNTLKNLELGLTAVSVALLSLSIFVPMIRELKSRNISLREANKEYEKVAGQLTQQNEHLQNYANITSHDLRSPVNNLGSLLKIYSQSRSEKEKTYILNLFHRIIDHLSGTLDELVGALGIRHEITRERELVKFEETYKKVCELLSGQILEANALIKSDFSRAGEVRYFKSYLESILINLLSNAIKYKSPKRQSVIDIETRVSDHSIILSVRDNGVGIDMEKFGPQLFGFHRTFHGNQDAKGVGLFITRAQVEATGGKINVVSKVDEGTTFEILFPN